MDRSLTMSVKEMAEQLHVSLPTAYGLTRRADFPAFRIGRKVLVPVDGFRAWLKQQEEAGKVG